MRANHQGRHLSGAEDLVPPDVTVATAVRFVERGLAASASAEVVVRIEPVHRVPTPLRLLPLFTVDMPTIDVLSAARALLASAGVGSGAAEVAIAALAKGAAGNGTNMRGAMLVDSASGLRLEPDRHRGVRARHFGVVTDLRATLSDELVGVGYRHPRTLDGWLVATKMVATPGALAELCWSDDPTYTTGYVALAGRGYVRLPCLKAEGDPCGGRALFVVPGTDAGLATAWLEDVPCLIEGPARIHPPQRLPVIMEALHS